MLLVGPETKACPLRTAAPGFVMAADDVLWAWQPAGPSLLPSQASVRPCGSHANHPDLSTLSSSPPCCPSLSRWPHHLCTGMVKESPHVPRSLFLSLSLSLLENECLWLKLTSPLPDEDCHPFTWGEKSLLPTRLTIRSPPHHSFPFMGKPPGGIVYSHWKRFALTSRQTHYSVPGIQVFYISAERKTHFFKCLCSSAASSTILCYLHTMQPRNSHRLAQLKLCIR